MEVQLIIDLLKYTTFFRRQPHSAVNFSLLQAVTSWIQEALRSAPVRLPDITRSAEILSRAVASTSGLGLNDIWSSWTNSISTSLYTAELEQAILDTDDSVDGYREFEALGISAHMLTSTQKFDPSCWITLLQDISKPSLPRLPTSTLWMTLFRRIWRRWVPNTILYSLKRVIILYQRISSRTPMSKIDLPRTDKISVIRELGVLAHMPDGDSFTVRHYIQQIFTWV